MRECGVSRFQWLVLGLVVVVGSLFRIYELSYRPLHADEGVNHFFLEDVRSHGTYSYSAKNYHGPLFFYLSALPYAVGGDSVSTLRISSVFFGSFLILLFPVVCREFSFGSRLFAASLLALSPSLVFYSRYAIHEMLFSLLSLAVGLFAFQFVSKPSSRYLYLLFGSLALQICTKETFIISSAAIGVALLLSGISQCRTALQWMRVNLSECLQTGGWSLLLIVFVYSDGWRRVSGLRELCSSLFSWTARSVSDVGHHKAARYYLRDVLASSEPFLLVYAAAAIVFGIVLYFRREMRTQLPQPVLRAIAFFGIWSIVMLGIYSAIPYKTPWLISSIVPPI
ncbi:MAG: TIGR03663 family protein, partial [Bdellovibrionales bacterium]|nr:TIGR03663 family protein [Bdellovibrionales bacterium]